MKKTTSERSTLGIIVEWLFGFMIVIGTAYIVFWKGHSGWWWLFALILLTGSTPKKEIEYDDEE